MIISEMITKGICFDLLSNYPLNVENFFVVSRGLKCSDSWSCFTSSNVRYKRTSSTTNCLILFL